MTPTKSLADAVEQNIKQDVSDNEEGAERTLTYEERLAEAKITLAEAHRIRDCLLVDGAYEETFDLTPATKVTFRTRSYADFVRVQQAISSAQPTFVAQRDEITLRYLLAASLVRFREETFVHPDPKEIELAEKAFDARHERVLAFPEQVVRLLATHLNVFDERVNLCLSEGAVESF